MLPNNLADWPSRDNRPAARATRQRRHTGAVGSGLMLVRGLLGFGFFYWLIPVAVRPNVSPIGIPVAEPPGGAISTSAVPRIDSAWVGIGGIRSRDLIQAGTQQPVSSADETRLGA